MKKLSEYPLFDCKKEWHIEGWIFEIWYPENDRTDCKWVVSDSLRYNYYKEGFVATEEEAEDAIATWIDENINLDKLNDDTMYY